MIKQKTVTSKQNNSIIEGTIWKQLLLFFFPILFGAFFQQLYNTVDAVIVGRFLGTDELGAVGGSAGTVIQLVFGFFMGLSSGATVIISQHYGAGDKENVSKAVHTAVAMSLAGGALFTILGVCFGPALLKAMKVPESVIVHSVVYLRVFFCGMIPNLVYNVSAAILRAVGDSKRPLYILIAACLLNVVLDIVFVVALDLRVLGVGLATILCQFMSAVMTLYCLKKTTDCYRVEFRKIRFYKGFLSRIIRIGLPAGMQSLAYSGANVVIHTGVNMLGALTVSANTAYSKIDCIFWMLINAFGVSVSTFVGQNYGAGRMDRVKRSMWITLGMALGATVILETALLLFGRYALMLFTTDEDVIRVGIEIMLIIVPYYLAYVPVEVLSGTFRSLGFVVTPMIMTLSGTCGLRLIWMLLFVPMNRTLTMTMVSFPMSWAVTGALFIIYYFYLHKSGKWPGSMERKNTIE